MCHSEYQRESDEREHSSLSSDAAAREVVAASACEASMHSQARIAKKQALVIQNDHDYELVLQTNSDTHIQYIQFIQCQEPARSQAELQHFERYKS
jgi:hypothetical protein